MKILYCDEIKTIVRGLDLLPLIKKGFVAYSEGRSVVPPVGELSFKDPPGDVHIKYGYITGDEYYVIKIASGFWNNEQLGISNGQGMMLLFKQQTGQCEAILLDDAYLTDVRTAVAGAICAELFTNEVNCIGVLGTGLQARMQVQYLKNITSCHKVLVWGRNRKKMEIYQKDMARLGFQVDLSSAPKEVAKECNLIITTTASTVPLLSSINIQPGTHITAMGSDTLTKQELEVDILSMADLVVADSIAQCKERGEIFHGLTSGSITKDEIVELGSILNGSQAGRSSPDQITVADLTGVAVQDIQIAAAVHKAYKEKNK
ncbi:MAG: ornithine cyclodeaminase family protein [Candidatus Marinimicrobia bacterium]|jgi:ornithine cyclodeaminase|nr:ornithine cyclodeaminase family protein [Candidatus Neomarinimicrobiota bacterium]HJM33460.1 ornithine cyclodeaminase family protein [Candidatus Neomarinimicrobiota bacterium]|tara:strand:+ start:300 stop:1253 length:954 start_codon:yes stop_codon:yes gene_type:complete